MKFKHLILTIAASGICTGACAAFSYKDIAEGKFGVRSVSGVRSMADGEHYTTTSHGKVIRCSYATGEVADTLYTGGLAFSEYELVLDERAILFETEPQYIYRHSHTARYFLYNIATKTTAEVVPEISGKRDLTISDSRIVFAADNNLYVYSTDGEQLFKTTDGERNHIINGTTDWVYEEEFAFTRAYALSPDGTRIAYLRADESAVSEFKMSRYDGKLYPTVYSYKYPKAGERNSTVELLVADIATGKVTHMDTGGDTDQYLPRLGWTPSGELWFFRENRLQNRFEVLLADAVKSRPIYTETSPKYVERIDDGTITFLPDGDRFIVRNETRTGYMHLYLYSISRGLLNAITSGAWEVTELNAVADGRVYYTSTEGSPLQRAFYSVKLNGKDKRKLTGEAGYYRIVPSAGVKYFLSYYSNARTPNIVRLCHADGTVIRTLEDNARLTRMIADERIPCKEFFTFTTSEGVVLNGYLKKPADFDSTKRYPVLMTQYSGPGSQQVADRWSVDWEDAVVQQGYVLACVDGRGTGFRGEEFKKCTYRDLGHLEVTDQIEAARYLARQSWVDASRIGIYGWSYGGFMALGCILKGADVFKMAIAVAPVTSWRYYDSIYTEVYNGLPQDNPSGYDDNSPINFANLLRGRLLIIHGSADDNVHLQNTMEMARALDRAGKQFDMMIYPDVNHSMLPDFWRNVRQKMVDYTLENL